MCTDPVLKMNEHRFFVHRYFVGDLEKLIRISFVVVLVDKLDRQDIAFTQALVI